MVLIYYVMHGRGNDEVAPWIETVQAFKAGKISWDDYKAIYLRKLNEFDASESKEWMEKRANEARVGHHVILVCFEKDATRCHRRLLAEEIAKQFDVEYKGELYQ